jgi:hypothetical protein
MSYPREFQLLLNKQQPLQLLYEGMYDLRNKRIVVRDADDLMVLGGLKSNCMFYEEMATTR